MSEELKPCPFCGNKYAGEIEHGDTFIGFYHIACTKCEAQIVGGTLEAAKQLWNTRPEEDQLKTQLAGRTHHHSDARVEAEVVVLREALKSCLVLISNSVSNGGKIKHMSTLEGRSAWYESARIERINVRQALADTSPQVAKIQAVLDAAEEQLNCKLEYQGLLKNYAVNGGTLALIHDKQIEAHLNLCAAVRLRRGES